MNDGILIAIVGTCTLLLLSVIVILILLILQKRNQQHTLEITEMRNKYEQELLRSQLEIQEQTLKTISQEIHDNIGQSLTLAKLQLHTLKENCSFEDIQPTRELISKSINDLRDLSKSLNPDRIADIGLIESIRHELQLLQKTNAMQTGLDVSGVFQKLPPEKEIIVFRIFQEMMSNAIRHSAAESMIVKMEYQPAVLQLSLQDNGKGFEKDYKKGIGINSMQNRAKLIDATFDIESSNEGTIVSIRIPLITPTLNGAPYIETT
jgi:signal transduction histidine kinase